MFILTFYILELKNRFKIIISGYTIVITLLLKYKETLLYLILKPIIKSSESKSYLICNNITDGFTAFWSIILNFSLHFCFLFFLLNVYFFFLPGVYKQEKKIINIFISVSLLFYFTILLLFYKFLLPTSWDFFLKFYNFKINSSLDHYNIAIKLFYEITLIHYIEYYFSLYFFCLIFIQLYIISTLKLTQIYNNFKFKNLIWYRKHLYFMFFVCSTIITPPDILSQVFLSIVFIIILEVTIFVIILKNKII